MYTAPRSRRPRGMIFVVRGCLTSVAIASMCACSAPPTPPPSTAPAAIMSDGATPSDGASVDAAIARGPLDCPRGTTAVREPWPSRGLACRDGAGAHDGPAIDRHPDGAIAVRAQWRGGVLDGTWQSLGPDGSVRVDGEYRDGKLHGTWVQRAGGVELGRSVLVDGTGTRTTWHPNGAVATVTTWQGGARDGLSEIRTDDGTTVVAERWKAGVRDGDHVVGLRSTLELRETWQAGVRTGARTLWRRGHLELDERYDRDGALDGAWTAYRSARKLREQGSYASGARTGPWRWFDAGGNETRGGTYLRGQRDGAWTEHAGKVLTWSGSYTRGLPDGTLVSYDARGTELGRDVLAGGTGTLRTWHAAGKVETETPLRRGKAHGVFRAFTSRGRVIASGRFVAGERDGAWWRTTGDVKREATYDHGVLDGTWQRSRGATPILVATYAKGARDGAYREAFADGTPALVGQFVADRRDGEWLTYRRDGSIAIRAHYAVGLLDGPWQELAADGAIEVSGQHQRGHRVGVWTTRAGTVDFGE